MRRNTYVTAALFVVFGVLTVIYMNMGEAPIEDTVHAPISTTLSERDPDMPVGADEYLDEDAQLEAEQQADTGVMADADVEDGSTDDAEESEEATEESDVETMTSLDVKRAERETTFAETVSSLTELIASADVDARSKSAAKDHLNELNQLASASRTLEAMFRHFGFEDTLVRANSETVQVSVLVNTIDDVPTREELVALYVMAGIEFGNHRHGNITINFEPLN